MAVNIQLRRDTAANWTSENPTLAEGEWGFETDTDKIKIGDGATAWTSLGYWSEPVHAAASDPHTAYQRESEKQANSGYPGLNSTGFVVGNGLAFPATQVPSADVNTLDDYEEGTWTPAIEFGGASVGATYDAANAGKYVKVGNLVLIQGRLRLTAKGSSTGAARIVGLPFNPSLQASVSFGYLASMSGLTGMLMGRTESSGITIVQWAATGNASVTDARFTATTDMMFSATFTMS